MVSGIKFFDPYIQSVRP